MIAQRPENDVHAITTDAAQQIERFPALSAIAQCRHGFITRIPGIDVAHDKAQALAQLDSVHRRLRDSLGVGQTPLATAEQIHGNSVAVIDHAITSDQQFAGVDGIVTNQRGVVLGIHVADCCAVFIVDQRTPAIGLVHSGRKGTELAITSRAIETMCNAFGNDARDLIVQLSPCIRPPHYEIDFAADIRAQCRAAGVREVHDGGTCTACDLARYYSYRAEKGRTGRMLALLSLSG